MTKNITTFQISANDNASNVFKKFADVVKNSDKKTKDFGQDLSKIPAWMSKGKIGADAFAKSIDGLNSKINGLTVLPKKSFLPALPAKQRFTKRNNDSTIIDVQFREKITDKLKPVPALVDKVKNKFKELDKVIIGVGISAGALAGIKSALNSFSTQEDAMAELRASMVKSDGTIDSSISKIEELSKSLGEKYPGSAADAINTMKALVQNGISVDKILGKQAKGYGGLGEASVKLGAVLKITGEEAATSLSKVADATRTGADDMNELADVYAKMKFSGLKIEDVENSLANSAIAMDLIKKTGIEGTKALAPFYVGLNQAGMQGETASIALTKLLRAGLNLKKIGDVNKILGKDKISFVDDKGNFAGAENFFKQILKIGKLKNDVARTKVLTKIFGEDAQTLQAMSSLIDKGQKGYDEIFKNLKGQGSLDQKLKETSSTISATTDRMAGSFENMKATIGKAFESDFKKIADILGDVSDKIEQLAEKFPVLTKLIGYTTLGIGLATLAMGAFSLASKTGLITTGITLFTSAFGSILSPIGLVIGALGVLGYIFRNEIMAFGGGFWTGIKTSLEPMGNTFSVISGLVGGLVDRFLSLFGETNQSKEGLEAWGSAGEIAGKVVGALLKGVLTTLTSIIDVIHLVGLGFDALSGKSVNLSTIGSATRSVWGVESATKTVNPATNSTINNISNIKNSSVIKPLPLNKGVMLPANPKALISTSKASVTGRLDININSQGKAQVAQMKSSSGFTLNAKTGNMVNAV